MTTRYARTPARRPSAGLSIGGLIVLVILLSALSVFFDTVLFQWAWNSFVVPHARGAARASLSACLVVGFVISVFIGAAAGRRSSSS